MAQRPLPRITSDNRPFWDAAREHRLALPYCPGCRRHFYPIAPVCPHCLSDAIEWRDVSGRGRVSSWTVFHKAFFPFFEDRLPYAVVQVELEEGPRINGNLLDTPIGAITMGMPVTVAFETVSDEVTLPQFRAAS